MEMIIQVVTFIIIPLDFIHKSYIHIVQYVSKPQIATYINLSFFWHSSEIYDYTKVRIVQYQALAGLQICLVKMALQGSCRNIF